MTALRLLLVATLALWAPGGIALAQEARTDDAVRRQAEELAREASKEFGEVLKGQVGTATQPRLPGVRRASRVAGKAWGAQGKGRHACTGAGVRVRLPGRYVVKRGDTLWGIARRHYGKGIRYRTIYAANRSRLEAGPDRILPCQRLHLPRTARKRTA